MAFTPTTRVHPGRIIARTLEREGMSQKNLCARMGITEKHLSHMINGEASITVESALLLETALGGSASFWINLEKNYREAIAREEREALLVAEIPLVEKFPYKELVKLKLVEQTRDAVRKVENLWKFFGVNSLSYVQDTEAVAYRKRGGNGVKSEAIAAWLRCGEIASREVQLAVFSPAKLKKILGDLRALTKKSPEEFSMHAPAMLSEVGVCLVYVPHFPGTGVSGAVRWVGENPLIQLSLFGKFADMFWFNLFHEIGHILLHGKKGKFLEFDKAEMTLEKEKEKEANDFASELLIPKDVYDAFVKRANFSVASIMQFANSIEIDPGVVEGRLCHDQILGWSKPAGLRTRLKFSEPNT